MITHSIGQLRGEGASPHTGSVGLTHPDHPVNLARSYPHSNAGSASHRRRGSDKRIGAVVNVQQRALGPLEEHVLTLSQGFVHQQGGVNDIRPQPLGAGPVFRQDRLHLQRLLAVDRRQKSILLLQSPAQLLLKDGHIQKVLHPQAVARHLVGVGRPNAPTSGAQGFASPPLLLDLVQHQMIGHHQMGVGTDAQARSVQAIGLQFVHLCYQSPGVHHQTIADDAEDPRPMDARRDQV